MSVFIGKKDKRVELAERKDATNPNLLLNSKGPFQPQSGNGAANYDNWQAYPDSTVYLEQGQTYTISGKTNGTWSGTHNGNIESDKCVIWFVSSAENDINVIVSSDNQVNNSNQFVWTNPTGTYMLRVNGYKPDDSTKAWNIKVEKGAVATPWCPAYEDYASNSNFNNLQNTVNSKVNVDGPLYKDLTQFNNWSDLFDGYSVSGTIATNGSRLVAFRDDTNGGNTIGGNGAGIAFGGDDTKGVLSVHYDDRQARIAGGNGTSPAWHEDIAWKSDITNLQNQINQQNQTIQSLTTRLTNVESEISYIKANYIEGKQFPASKEAQAVAWENANPQGIAFITSN